MGLAIIGIFIAILTFLFSPLLDRLYKTWDKIKLQDKNLFEKVIKRISKERPNFKYISENRPFNSKLHKKAVLDYSFELIIGEVGELKNIKKYREISKNIIKAAQEKNVIRLLELLDVLEKRLKKDM